MPSNLAWPTSGLSVARRIGLPLVAAVLLSLVLSEPAWAPPPPQRPGKPLDVTVTPGNGQAVVSWVGNYTLWGYIPTGYVAKTQRGNTCSDSPPDPVFPGSCTLTGLTNGLHYSVHVYATYVPFNKVRKGPPSAKVKFVPEA
jgi:hypothetical protein